MPPKNATDKKTAGFEEQLERLQKITEDLELGELSLEESLALYKEGVDLSRRCRKALEKARHTVKVYTAEGLRDFTEGQEPDAADNG